MESQGGMAPSTAPAVHPLAGRAMPRWSVGGQFCPIPTAGLPGRGATVWVGPPLPTSTPSCGLLNTVPVVQATSAVAHMACVDGHCRLWEPVLEPTAHAIGAPQSLVVLSENSVLLMLSVVPPAIAAPK